MARDLSGGGGSSRYVGNRTQPIKAETHEDIVFSTTNNKVKCPYCNGTWFEVKGGDSIDNGELPDYYDGYGAAGQLNMVVLLCHCGREFVLNLATDGEFTEQV